MEDETRMYDDECRRLKDDLRRERDRLTGLEAQVQEQLIETRRTAERERERDRNLLNQEWQERLEDAHRLHQVDQQGGQVIEKWPVNRCTQTSH